MHLQKLLPRGKRTGNLSGGCAPVQSSEWGRDTSQAGGDPAMQEGCLGVLCHQRALEYPEILLGTRNGYMNVQALT